MAVTVVTSLLLQPAEHYNRQLAVTSHERVSRRLYDIVVLEERLRLV